MNVPVPQDPEYHIHFAPVPRLPPETVIVVELPGQIVEADAETEVGSVERVFTVTITFPQLESVPPNSSLT